MDSLASDEIRYFWMLRTELVRAVRARDDDQVLELLDDMEVLRQFAENRHVRVRCTATLEQFIALKGLSVVEPPCAS